MFDFSFDFYRACKVQYETALQAVTEEYELGGLDFVKNLGRDPKKSYNFVCESGYFVNYCSFGGMIKISSVP